MVYLRAFSFTDATNVTLLDDHRPLSPGPESPEQQLFLHKVYPAVYLIRLRRLQSSSYQELYQSSLQLLEEPWPVISKALKSLHMWDSQFPNMLKEPIRRLLRSDLLYSNILILSPPGLSRPLPKYGTALIFDCATEFAELVSRFDDNPAEFAVWTFHDFRRTAYVSSIFLAVLEEVSNSLFHGVTPQTPQNAEPSSALPKLGSQEP